MPLPRNQDFRGTLLEAFERQQKVTQNEQVVTQNEQVLKEKNQKKNNYNILTSKEKEREKDEQVVSSSSKKINEEEEKEPFPPTWEMVINYAIAKQPGISVEMVKEWFAHRENHGWKMAKGGKIMKWRADLFLWDQRAKRWEREDERQKGGKAERRKDIGERRWSRKYNAMPRRNDKNYCGERKRDIISKTAVFV